MMNVSWYHIYKQSNVLPFDEPEGKKGFGYDRINQMMTEDTSKKELENNPKYLGSGHSGLAVDIGENKARKYTRKAREAKLAGSLINNTKYPVVKVYDVKEIQRDLWAIDTEKIIPLRKSDLHEMDKSIIDMFFDSLVRDQEDPKDGMTLLYKYPFYSGGKAKEFNDQEKEKIESYFNRVKEMKILHEINLSWDCQLENVGINSKGEWVVFDLDPYNP